MMNMCIDFKNKYIKNMFLQMWQFVVYYTRIDNETLIINNFDYALFCGLYARNNIYKLKLF